MENARLVRVMNDMITDIDQEIKYLIRYGYTLEEYKKYMAINISLHERLLWDFYNYKLLNKHEFRYLKSFLDVIIDNDEKYISMIYKKIEGESDEK